MRVYVFALVENMREYIKSNTNDKGVSLSLSPFSTTARVDGGGGADHMRVTMRVALAK